MPDRFALSDPSAIASFIRSEPFGMVISQDERTLNATHVPFAILSAPDEPLRLGLHMARANAHWRSLNEAPVLAIFQGPHAYISPRWYGDPLHDVPTWDYCAVHCHGTARLVGAEQTRTILDALVALMEGDAGWSRQNADRALMAQFEQAIVGIEITVEQVQAKRKLSQNAAPADRASIIAGLSRSRRGTDRDVADAMRTLISGG